MADGVDLIRERIARLAADRSVVVVALDGRSGAGKSTLARRLAEHLDAVVIEGDDFYAGGSDEEWRVMSPADRAARCIDWRRQRPVLEALRVGKRASWHPFDWQALGAAGGGRLLDEPLTAGPAPVVILEGAYSARPELADLLDLRVLLTPPDGVRRRQLREREGEAYADDWEMLWASAEEHHFGTVMPPAHFDLVIDPTAS